MKNKNWIIEKEDQTRLLEALNSIRQGIRWKTGKDVAHLTKRQRMNHLSDATSLSDYEQMISDLVNNNDNILYLYEFNSLNFYGIRGFSQGKEWLVIFGAHGIMETAFPPEDMDDYLKKRGFVLIGPIREALKWT